MQKVLKWIRRSLEDVRSEIDHFWKAYKCSLSLEKDSCSDSTDMVNGHPVGGSRWWKEWMRSSSYFDGLLDDVQRYYDDGGLCQGVYW